MNNRFYIKNSKTNEIIDVFKLSTERSKFLSKLIKSNNLTDGMKFHLDNEYLKKKILNLLEKRKNNDLIDFGNRFEDTQCYQLIEFNNKEYKLTTSGKDNLIIFAFNLFKNSNSELKIVSI